MMKHLTVGMPLAVPHQRPPSKYASHPYPVLDTDIVVMSYSFAGSGSITPYPKDDLIVSYGFNGFGENRSVVKFHNLTDSASIDYKFNGVGKLESQELKDPIVKSVNGYVVISYGLIGEGALKRVLIQHSDKQDNLTINYKFNGVGSLA